MERPLAVTRVLLAVPKENRLKKSRAMVLAVAHYWRETARGEDADALVLAHRLAAQFGDLGERA